MLALDSYPLPAFLQHKVHSCSIRLKTSSNLKGAFGKAAPADQERKSAMVGAARHAAGDD
jgi:hypothetical protein